MVEIGTKSESSEERLLCSPITGSVFNGDFRFSKVEVVSFSNFSVIGLLNELRVCLGEEA